MAGFFGPVIDSSDVEQAMIAFLEDRLPEQVEYMRRQKDPTGEKWPDGVSPIRTFHIAHLAGEKWPEDQLPMFIVQSPGETGKDSPRIDGDGMVWRKFGLALTAISSGVDEAEAKELARLYSSAARNAIIQNPDLHSPLHPDGFASGLTIRQEQNSPSGREVEKGRFLMATAVPYEVDVANATDVDAGDVDRQEDPTVEPPPRPVVKKGGGSVTIKAI